MPPTASLLEIVWTIAAALGFGGALGVAWDAARDWRYDQTHPAADPIERARRRLVAVTVLTNRSISAFVQFCFVFLGLRAMYLPPNPHGSDLGALVTGVLFLVGSLAMSAGSIIDYIRRVQFRRLGATDPRKEQP